MGGFGCLIDGKLNEEKFGEPLPWIGIYVAIASSACAVLMACDAFHGFCQRKFWFPCKFFSLNATSLTILAVAVKFSVDLNTAMPRKQDQLAKLSSAVFICTIMGNTMPSLGTMETQELAMNIMALGILVITMIVNICIQLGTGVIFVLFPEYGFIMFLMLLLLVILSFSALAVPINKQYLEMKYNKRYELALEEGSTKADTQVVKKLNEYLMKHWVMAHTSSPQFVIGRSVTCIASGALSLLSAMTLAETMVRSYLMPWSFKFCTGESDYKWSTIFVLAAQTIAVGVGTIAPAVRCFTAINFRCPSRGDKIHINNIFKVEHYWIQMLGELKECPEVFRIQNRSCRKIFHHAKNKFLNVCIGMQTAIVLGSKAIQFISIYFASQILLFCDFCINLKKKFVPNCNLSGELRSESQSCSKLDLSPFVVHLEGEDELVEIIMKNNRNARDHWMRKGKKKQPENLLKLLKQSNLRGFKGVQDFDSHLVPCLDSSEPPNCWALPVVTLTSIAVALPNIKSCSVKNLMLSVHESLMYIRLVEENLDSKGDLHNMRKAADSVWLGVDLSHMWLDVNLRKLSLQANSSREVLEALADAAMKRFMQCKETLDQCYGSSKWPIKALASNSMYRVSQTILLNYQRKNQTSERLFEVLAAMISDIVGACLTNLPCAISLNCLSRAIDAREERVRDTVLLLGKSEKILKILHQRGIPSLHPDQMTSIDEWRSLHIESHIPTSPSSELGLSIE